MDLYEFYQIVHISVVAFATAVSFLKQITTAGLNNRNSKGGGEIQTYHSFGKEQMQLNLEQMCSKQRSRGTNGTSWLLGLIQV
jgi:hypothetical protein